MTDFYMAGSHTGNDFLIGRSGTMSLTVLEVMADGQTLRCGVKVTTANTIENYVDKDTIANQPSSSQIRGTARDPYRIPPEELQVMAVINRSIVQGPRTVTDTTMIGGATTTIPGHPLYRELDPMADYQVGDEVCVIEQFHVTNYGRNSAGFAANDTDLLLDFVTNPRPYMEKGRPEDEGFEVTHTVIGKWRGTPSIPTHAPHYTLAGPANSLTGQPGAPGYVGQQTPPTQLPSVYPFDIT